MSQGIAEPPAAARQAPRAGGGYRAVLTSGPFLRLWLAQALSQTAQQTINFTLLIQVRQIIELRAAGGANTALSLLIICFATPPILFSALAGVVVDRSNKRVIMATVNALRALCLCGYLLLNPGWPILTALLYIYAICFAFSTIGQLFGSIQTRPVHVTRRFITVLTSRPPIPGRPRSGWIAWQRCAMSDVGRLWK